MLFIFRASYQVGGKRKTELSYGIPKLPRYQQQLLGDNLASTSAQSANQSDVGGQTTCEICEHAVSRRYFANHLRSKSHKEKVLLQQHQFSNVSIISTAFGSRILSYRITSPTSVNSGDPQTPEMFISSIRETILFLLHDCLKELTTIKVNFIVHADFVQETKDIKNSFDFQTSNWSLCVGDNLDHYMISLSEDIKCKMLNFEKKDSGWSLHKIKYIEMNVNQFNPLRGSSYIDLPIDIKRKKAVINVQNNDVQCLKWALLSALYPANSNPNRVSSYVRNERKLNFDGISFPVKLKDLEKVEKLNNISINVFGLDFNKETRCNTVVGPLYFTKSRKTSHVNLLYLTNNHNAHYCFIKNISRLVGDQITKHHGVLHICDGCLLYFSSKEKLTSHQARDCMHLVTKLPKVDNSNKSFIQFDKFQRKLKLPFVIYADFEAILKPIQTCDPDPLKSYTNSINVHKVFSYGYFIKCSYDDGLSKYRTYAGVDCTEKFMESLVSDVTEITKINCFRKCPRQLYDDDERIVEAKSCFICNKELENDRTSHYDWHTGEFSGIAHKKCSCNYRVPFFIPIFLHNLSNYDAHFIVHALNFSDGDIEVIPNNKEKYISFTKKLYINGKLVSLRFLDSFRFMGSSLDSLSKNLVEEQFRDLKKQFPRRDDFTRLMRKGVFPYEYMTSYESLLTTTLPSKSLFYSSLTNTGITDDEYNHAQDIWNNFNCQNMLDYSNIYLKTDVMLLTDIFENFRDVCMKTYDLDPAQYYTAPGLSWDAMLKYTNIKLELLTDFEMIAFIKSGIRGGISVCCNRYGKANNKYMQEFNPDLPKSYLMYFDANNLYGWAMSQYLPEGNFKWVSTDIDFSVSPTSDIGYILEVDLEYPKNIHDLHSDFPLCAENIAIGGSKDRKLVPNLHNKSNYVLHYRNLIQCLQLGMKLVKVYRILQFKQSPWLNKYIDLNTELRKLAKSDFEKDFYKLMNNSVFGKTMENIEKRVDVKLLTRWEDRGKSQGVQSLIARPEFHSVSIFSESLVAVQLKKTSLFYNKPIYLGLCILDISKTLMYNFHYNYIKLKYNENVKLLYTDTDSFVYQIFTDDFYHDTRSDLPHHFDTSDYPSDNVFDFPQLNKKKIGYFKDENNGKIFIEFVGLRSKMYALNVENTITAKAKGVNKSVSKNMKIEMYKACLFNKNVKMAEMCRFRSIKHNIFTQKINKICLSYNDTKRYLIPNSTDTYAWGHYKIN